MRISDWSSDVCSSDLSTALLGRLADPESLHRARCWGLSLRLGLRITGGPAHELKHIELSRGDGVLLMQLPSSKKMLYGEAIGRRHRTLANAMALEAKVPLDRKRAVWGKSVSVTVELGGRRI